MAVDNLRPLAYAVITIAFALGTASIFLRLYCRWRLRTFGLDDAAAIFLFCVNNVQQAILYIFLHHGCGLPADRAPAGILTNIRKFLFVEEVFYMFVHFVLKQTFLLFYLRLSPSRRFQCAVYTTMAICVIFLTAEWLLAFLQARPLAAYFHPENYPNAKRLSEYVVQMVPTALNAFSDVIILILPVPTVLNLQMSPRRKIAVLGIICFGSLSVVTALCRFVVQKQLISEPDTSYIMGRMVIVAGIEIQIAVVAVNLPALRSLFTKVLGSSHEASGSYPYNNQKGVHRLSSLKSHSKGPGVRKGLRRSEPRDGVLGATLTGSEEELMRQQGGSASHIHVITNVDVTSHEAVDEDCRGDIGLPSTEKNKHVH
ncbi:uncharacterized protein DSM5745_02336 [Aspergillus mulundensis]|uniref:Rhodopsin domain-containing protein n=1 Tax=Aspergillus mulundensis TaxID=1810919 RepID=A0A3D8SWL7_9EURO|nr:Uncharacterized protein DSM5745_02336 [Aspergillus mulundensis]RDW90561.1 Uncharacterized protein DSM5745_02336 [Aspergillus mulundensis]